MGGRNHRPWDVVTYSEWVAANPEQRRQSQVRYEMKKRYGITPEDYEVMLARQNGVCAICGKPEPRGQRLSVDHTGDLVRGLLCTHCNPGLGYFLDDPALLRAAADYLDKCQTID